ncbi:hypothetical protein N8739_00660 [Luminiphilus sp.]|nr:hypothetical protein [Luminiphilus sp.]
MKNAKELIEAYGTARSTYRTGSAEDFVQRIVYGEAEVPPLSTVAAAVGAAGYRGANSMSDTPRTAQVERWYSRALYRKHSDIQGN